MDHIAIMKKSWGLTEKILNGRKKIESRWYLSKRLPWHKIKKGDIVYFKNSGEPVCVKAEVKKIEQFCGLTPKRVKDILNKYGKADGIEKNKISEFFNRFKNKKYCVLVFLKNVAPIKPFRINKKGLGLMSAWISSDDISKIKICA
jgi:ASC-1-like (ASCH) protein